MLFSCLLLVHALLLPAVGYALLLPTVGSVLLLFVSSFLLCSLGFGPPSIVTPASIAILWLHVVFDNLVFPLLLTSFHHWLFWL